MDNLRGQFPDNDDAYYGTQDLDGADDEVDSELPPLAFGQDERRMQVRAYNFWTSLLGDRNYPSASEFDPASQPDFGPYSVLLNFSDDIENPIVAYVGDKLAQECDSSDDIERLSDVPSRSLLSRITDHYLQIIANQAPIGFEAEFVNQRGATILYRGILLPFSSDNEAIDYIYGVINWKELADQATADELLLQIDQALEPKRADDREELELTDWADVPVDQVTPLELDTPLEPGAEAFPEPSLSAGSVGIPTGRVDFGLPAEERTLSDWLAAARDRADEAAHCEKRTHQALYAAIGLAHDFALAAQANGDEYQALLRDSGLASQDRSPMVPVIRLVFGAHYDKTRVAEYAAALDYARRLGLGQGGLGDLLAETPGGLKALVGKERGLRKLDKGTAPSETRQDKLIARLRKLEGVHFEDLATSGAEFTLLVARRTPGGHIEILGEVDDQPALIEKAARHLVR